MAKDDHQQGSESGPTGPVRLSELSKRDLPKPLSGATDQSGGAPPPLPGSDSKTAKTDQTADPSPMTGTKTRESTPPSPGGLTIKAPAKDGEKDGEAPSIASKVDKAVSPPAKAPDQAPKPPEHATADTATNVGMVRSDAADKAKADETKSAVRPQPDAPKPDQQDASKAEVDKTSDRPSTKGAAHAATGPTPGSKSVDNGNKTDADADEKKRDGPRATPPALPKTVSTPVPPALKPPPLKPETVVSSDGSARTTPPALSSGSKAGSKPLPIEALIGTKPTIDAKPPPTPGSRTQESPAASAPTPPPIPAPSAVGKPDQPGAKAGTRVTATDGSKDRPRYGPAVTRPGSSSEKPPVDRLGAIKPGAPDVLAEKPPQASSARLAAQKRGIIPTPASAAGARGADSMADKTAPSRPLGVAPSHRTKVSEAVSTSPQVPSDLPTGTGANETPRKQSGTTDSERETVTQAKPQQQEKSDPGDDGPRRRARRRPAAPSRERIAANDDVPSIGGLIFALNQRPSRKPFVYATAASIGWSILIIAYVAVVLLPQSSAGGSFTDLFTSPWLLTTLATWLCPMGMFWFLAGLAWRAEELHLRSTAMTEVAVRLAEPDRMAEQSVASLGQAVRRQVSFMNDAVSRALGRAGELEALVHNEVSSLEQSYEENERKIRSLIREISGERNALMNTGQRFQHTLASLGTEVPAIIAKLNDQQVTLAQIIEGAAENLTSLETEIGSKTGQLETSLDERTTHLHRVLDDYTGALSNKLTDQSTNMQTMLTDYTTALGIAFDNRTQQMHGLLESGRASIEDNLQQHQKAIDTSLSKHGQIYDARAQELTSLLDKQRVAFRGQIETHHKAIESQTGTIHAQFDRQREELQGKLSGHQERVEEIISDRTQTLQTVFEEYARALDTTLANRAQALDAQLVERTKALDDAFSERLRLFDEAILRSTMAIDSAVGENAKSLTSAMETHAEQISRSLSYESEKIDQTLMEGINAVRATSENVTQQSLKAIEGLAGQADLLRNVSEGLLGQIGSVTNRFEDQGQAILRSANSLETANQQIDRALQQRTHDMNETLTRMSGTAEELGRMAETYSTNLEGSLTEAQQRARLIAEELTRGAAEHSRATLSDIERLRSETTIEAEKARAQLLAEFASVSREVTDRLGRLSTQFTETSGEVREQAARAAQQLENEQQRLKDQLDYLPAATEETSAAMRKALQDQLRALDQLTALASRTSHANDSAPGRQKALPSRSQAAPPAHHAAEAPSKPIPSTLSSALAKELSGRNGGAAGNDGSDPSSEGNRWSLGTLLARASKDDASPAASPPRALNRTEGGGGIDVQALARALDPAGAAAIWSRFRNGQRGFMVPSIYAPEARAMFEQIERRYENEAGFQTNVDRFLIEFERGLADLDHRDPTRQSSDAQIVTDTGRVYLVLAHAAKRLV
jgi:hypothetical protein